MIYRPGSTTAPLSRLPATVSLLLPTVSRLIPTVSLPSYNDAKGYIHKLETTSLPVVYTHNQLKAATEKDEELQSVKHAIFNNWAKENIDKGFLNIKEELSIYDGVILRQNRKVIPQDLTKQKIDITNEEYQGIVKIEPVMRSKMWCRGKKKNIEEYIKSCHACQTEQNGKCSYPEPVKSLPAEPWQRLAIDLCYPSHLAKHF